MSTNSVPNCCRDWCMIVQRSGATDAYVAYNILTRFFQVIRSRHPGGEACVLILDNLAAHRTSAVFEEAAKHNIALFFTPPNT